MLDKFLSYINQEKLFLTTDKILLAVSGGMDSMAMLYLFRLSGLAIGVAHVNHNLRGNESDHDEKFIKDYCTTHQIDYYVDAIEPSAFDGQNMHDFARKHRYAFFNKISNKHKYNYIATAHHQDDVVETFMMNVVRGSGLNGLSSIPNKRQNIVRPILFATRSGIESFVKTHNIPYREDSSNSSDKYLRNKLRHHILPAIYELDPRAVLGITHTVSNIKSSSELLNELMDLVKKDVVSHQNDKTIINLTAIKKFTNATAFLFEAIKEFGFNHEQCVDILADHKQNSRIYLTNNYESIFDRDHLYIRPFSQGIKERMESQINLGDEMIMLNKIINIDLADTTSNSYDGSNQTQFICIDQYKPPFTIRKWLPGDSFAPLGMNGKRQKLQDFLTNIKLPPFEKSEVSVILAGETIISVLGYRISDNVKITSESEQIAKISIKDLKYESTPKTPKV